MTSFFVESWMSLRDKDISRFARGKQIESLETGERGSRDGLKHINYLFTDRSRDGYTYAHTVFTDRSEMLLITYGLADYSEVTPCDGIIMLTYGRFFDYDSFFDVKDTA